MLGYFGSEPGKRSFAYKGLLLSIFFAGTFLTAPLNTRAQKVYATSQDNGVNGICLLCGVSNPSNPVSDPNHNSFSTFNITVGLLGVNVYQDLIFPGVNPDPGCDSLVIGIGNNGSTLTAALLGGVTVQTYNGSTANNDLTNVTTNNLKLLSTDTTRGLVIVRPAAAFDRVRISLNSSLVGALSGFRLYYAYRDKTIIPLATLSGGDSVTVCAGGSVTLTASDTIPGTTINWFTQASGGTSVHTGSSFQVTPTATTTYYAEADLGSCSSPSRTPVTIVVNPLPPVPSLVNASVTVCSGNPATFMVQSPQAGTTYNWYTVATGGTPVATGTSFTIPNATATQNYYLEAQSATTGCVSATRATAVLTVNPTPDSVQIAGSNPVTVSQGQTATFTVSSPDPTLTYNWYDAPTGGNLVATGTSFTTPAIYAPTSYYVGAVSNQGCTSTGRTRVTVNVLTPNNITCGLANTQQSPVITGVCLLCTVTNPNLAVDGDPSTASSINSTVGALGSVGQLLGFPNTYPAGDSIILDLQIPGSNLSANLLGGVRVQTYLNGTANASDVHMLADTVVRLELLGTGNTGRFRVILPAQNTFNGVLVSISGTVTALSTLEVYDAAALVPRPTAASTLLVNCGPSSDTLTAIGPAGATFNWYNTATGGTSLATGSTYVTPVVTTNTTYYLESSRFGCANGVRTPVTIDINTPPAAPTLVTPSVTICSGDSATLSATVPAGVTVKWYATPTGGTSLDSGAAFTTPALSATTIYYAEASSSGCVSATRSPDTVKVNATPLAAVVTPSPTTISAGQSVSLTATSGTAGVQFNWYTQAIGGTPVFTGATYTVSPTATTVYYVVAVNTTTGCSAAARTADTVFVLTGGGPAVPCGSATGETTAVNGLCIGCSVSNEALAVDGNANTGSSLNVTAGLLGGNVQQTLIFPFTADAGDTISIKFVSPGTTLSLGLLGTLQVATFNGNNSNNDQQSVPGSSAIKVNLGAGSDSAIVTFAPTSPYDRVQVTLGAGVAGVLTSINIDYASSQKPSPVLQADTVTVCSGSQATLKAVAPPDATFRWYTTATGGSPVFTGATFQTPVLTDTTVYYAESMATVNGCAGPRRTQAVVLVPAPPAPPTVAHNSVSVCTGSPATLVASAPAGVTVRWYTTATGGTPVFTGDTLVTPALDSTKVYYAEAANTAGCTSTSRTTVTANIVASPATPTVTPSSDTICAGGSVQLVVASTTPGVQFNWYTSATTDTVLFTGSTYTTPVLDSNATYYVASVAGTCASASRATANVVVHPRPAAPTISVSPASASVNAGNSATLTASSTTTGATFNWYTTATGGSPVFTGPTFVTPALTSTVTYYAEAVGTGGCTSTTRTAVTITVIPGINVSCGIANQQTNQVSGLCIGCSVSNPGAAVDADTTTYSTLSIGASVAGSVAQTLIFPEVSQPGDSIQIELSANGTTLSAAVLGAIQVSTANGATSNNDAMTLSGSAVSVNLLGSSGHALVSFAPTHAYDRVTVQLNAGLVSALTGVNIYYATDQVNAPVVANRNPTICSGTKATLTATTSVNATVEWFSTPTGGTALGAGDTLVTPALTQTTTYYAEALRKTDSCANPNRVPVTVSVVSAPVVPTVTPNPDTVCSGQSAVLQASATGGATVQWYDSASGGNLLFTGNIFTTPALTAGKTFYASTTNGTCASPTRDAVPVVVGQAPQVPAVSPADTTICSGQAVTLNVVQPQTGVVYNWYTVLSGGTPVFTGNSFVTPVLTSGVTYYLEAVNTTSHCTAPSARTAVTVNVGPVPTAPPVTSSQVTVCSGQPATVSVSNPQSGILYQWYSAASGGNLLFTGASYTIASATTSESVYVQAASAGGCSAGSRTAVSVVVDSIPTTPQLQATNVSVCTGGQATFTITAPQTGVTYTWYDAPTGGNLLTTGTTYTTGALSSSATYYIQAVNAAGCTGSARTAVNANVVQTPAAPAVVTSPAVICSGTSATLQIANPQGGIVYNWYDAPTGGNLVFQGNPFVTPNLTSGMTYYVAAVNGLAGCTSTSRTADVVSIGTQPATPVLVNPNIQVCAGANVTLQVQSPQANLTYTWLSSPTATTPLFTGPTYVLTGDTASGTYYVSAATSGGCTSAGDGVATVTVDPTPGNPVVQTPNETICPGNTASFTISNPQAGVTYSWYASSSGGTALGTGSSFTTPTLATSTSYYVGATNAGACSSPGLTMVTATVSNNLTPPQLVATQVDDCSGQPTRFVVSNPQGGLTYNWYDAPTGGNLLFTGPAYTLNGPLAGDTFYVASSASSGACVSASRTMAVLTIVPLPNAPSLVTSGAQVCSGGNVSLQVSNPVSGDTYNWYTAASGGSPVFTGTVYNLSNVSSAAEYYVESVSSGCSSASRTPVTVSVAAPASTPTVTASSTGVCAGDDAVLTAASSTSGATFDWYSNASGSGTPIATGSIFTTGALTKDTTFYVAAVTAQGCSGSALASIHLTQLQPLASPTVTVLTRTPTSVTFQWTPVSGAVAYQVSLDSGVTFVTPSSGVNGTTETVNNLAPNQTVSCAVKALGAAPCQTSTASARAAGVSDNPLGDNIFVPNVFSPNGDGVNDVLYVYSNAIASMVFRIYNQWGQEIFESRSINTGWDGTSGGQKQPVGVYVYVLQAVMQDGTTVNKKGSVTLIR